LGRAREAARGVMALAEIPLFMCLLRVMIPMEMWLQWGKAV